MSQLRDSILIARRAYRQGGYPGDLAADILPLIAAGRRRWIGWAGGVGALAAAIAIVMAAQAQFARLRAIPSPAPPAMTLASQSTSELALEGIPSMPMGLSIVPEYESFTLPAMPEFPSMEMSETSPEIRPSTTQESA